MTSGNVSDEPIAYEDDDAHGAWPGSPTCSSCTTGRSTCAPTTRWSRSVAGGPILLRRSRGHVPASIDLPLPCPRPLLAVGARAEEHVLRRKGTSGLGEPSHRRPRELGDAALLPRGDRALRARVRGRARGGRPRPPPRLPLDQGGAGPRRASSSSACSTTTPTSPPASPSTARRARQSARSSTAPDYGRDGTVWGGELLAGDLRDFERAGLLFPVRLPGGDGRDPRAVADGLRLARGGTGRGGAAHSPGACSARAGGTLGAGVRAGQDRRFVAGDDERGPALRCRGRALRGARRSELRGTGSRRARGHRGPGRDGGLPAADRWRGADGARCSRGPARAHRRPRRRNPPRGRRRPVSQRARRRDRYGMRAGCRVRRARHRGALRRGVSEPAAAGADRQRLSPSEACACCDRRSSRRTTAGSPTVRSPLPRRDCGRPTCSKGDYLAGG